MKAEIIETVRDVLKNSIDEKTKTTSQNFFKEKIKYYGVKVPTVNRISKEYYILMESKTKRYAIEKMPKELKASAMEKK